MLAALLVLPALLHVALAQNWTDLANQVSGVKFIAAKGDEVWEVEANSPTTWIIKRLDSNSSTWVTMSQNITYSIPLLGASVDGYAWRVLNYLTNTYPPPYYVPIPTPTISVQRYNPVTGVWDTKYTATATVALRVDGFTKDSAVVVTSANGGTALQWNGTAWASIATGVLSASIGEGGERWIIRTGSIVCHWLNSTWTTVPTPEAFVYVYVQSSSRVIGLSATGVLYLYNPDTNTWTSITAQGSVVVSAIGANKIYAVVNGVIRFLEQ